MGLKLLGLKVTSMWAVLRYTTILLTTEFAAKILKLKLYVKNTDDFYPVFISIADSRMW